MAGFDQLGLFSNGSTEKVDKKSSKYGNKLNISVEFSNSIYPPKIDDAMRKITKEIELLDRFAKVCSSRDHDLSWVEQEFLAVDVETTGLEAASKRIIELAMVPYNFSDDVKPLCQLFSVGESLPQEIVHITGISDAMLKNQPSFAEHADDFLCLMKRASFVVAYNAKFDRPFLESEMARVKKVLPDIPWVDPFVFVCELDRYKRGKKLTDATKRWGVALENAHRAMADAKAAGDLMLKMADKIGCRSLNELIERQKILEWQNAHNMAELKRSNNWTTNR